MNQRNTTGGRPHFVDTAGCPVHPGCHCDPASPCPITQERRHASMAAPSGLDAHLLLSSRAVVATRRPSLTRRALRAIHALLRTESR